MTHRRDSDPPPAIAGKGWRYHHLGIPTTVPHPAEEYLEQLKLYVRGFQTSPFGIEWMRFAPGSQAHELVRRIPHIAFEVDNLEEAIGDFTPLGPITSPSPGVRVAMIVHDGAPVELIEFTPRGQTPERKRES
jgi:hypothetical protein